MGRILNPEEKVILTANISTTTPKEVIETLKRHKVPMTVTVCQDLPEEVAEVLRKHDLKIRLDKVIADKLFDQVPGLAASDGCWSSPSGPGC